MFAWVIRQVTVDVQLRYAAPILKSDTSEKELRVCILTDVYNTPSISACTQSQNRVKGDVTGW